MSAALDDVRRELARANRILAHEDVLDAFGHGLDKNKNPDFAPLRGASSGLQALR